MRRLSALWLVGLANLLQATFVGRPVLYKVLLCGPLSGVRAYVGAWRAWANVERSYRRVPAYRDFLDARGGLPQLTCRNGVPDLSVVPETDKDSYVRRYSHEQRCVGGRLPSRGVVVDESSGSSGRPTSWVRGPAERWTTKCMLQLSFRSALGDQPLFVLNAFALGAWATGLNVTLSLHDLCTIKSTGPDIDKIVATLEDFGPGHDYVVMGYPPFLKALADDPRIDWTAYRVSAVFGGEAISEPMRSYLLRFFSSVLGSYGASDLEINMAAESPFTVRLRREISSNPALRERLTRPGYGVLPMILQYNPLAYHMDTNAAGELVVTLSRPTGVSPKIRYNIHDIGHVVRFEQVAAALQRCGLAHLVRELEPIQLPLLFVYGRSDLSVDYFGANVTPAGVGEILFSMDDLAPHLHSFRLISREDDRHNKALEVAIELGGTSCPQMLDRAAIGHELFERLAAANADFRNAYTRTATSDQLPEVTLHRRGTGPFAGPDRIKHQYVATAVIPDRL